MAELDDAIEAAGRQVRATVTVTWPGGTNPIFETTTNVTINQSVNDLPMAVTQIAGTAAASASITLEQGKTAADGNFVEAMQLSPFSMSTRSTRTVPGYGLRLPITVTESIWLPISQTWSNTVLFTGFITSYALNDDGSTTLQCQDKSAGRGTPTLPAAAGGMYYGTGSDTRISPASVIDLCLRSLGHYITPPARTTRPLLSVPNIGSCIPEIGSLIDEVYLSANMAMPAPFNAALPGAISVGINSTVRMTSAVDTRSGQQLLMEGWAQLAPSGPFDALPVWAVGSAVAVVGFTPEFSTTPVSTKLRVTFDTLAIDVPQTLVPVDGGWHYLAIRSTVGGNTVVHCDGVSQTFAGAVSASPTGNDTATIYRPTLGFQVSQPTAAPTYNSGWTPMPTTLVATARLAGLPRVTGTAWQVIQQIAAAYGDVVYFDGGGGFRYTSQASWNAKRIGAPARSVTGTRILSGAPSWDDSGMRSSVSAQSIALVARQSTTAAPAWQATETYSVAGRSTTVIAVDLDYTVFAAQPFKAGYPAAATWSWVLAVRQSAVGDGAAATVPCTVSIAPTTTGIAITITNPNSFAISLWAPGDGGANAAGPSLTVHGKTIRAAAPVTASVNTGAVYADALTLDTNDWRQEANRALTWVGAIAPGLSMPQIQWPTIVIPADPRRQIGDVISLQDTRYMDVAHPVQIVGIAWNLPANGQHTMALTVLSAYAPTGWILGVPGRSELGVTTQIVA